MNKMLLLFSSTIISGTAFAEEAKKPNILFIMSDDHAAHAIGAYGGRLAALNPTPTLDQLAKEGIIFNRAYCTNAICTPSRACIMTGQYSKTNGVLNLQEQLPPSKHYLAMEMKKGGYETAIIGKWHLKTEPNFDYYKVLGGQGRYNNPTFKEKTKGTWPNNVVKTTGHSSDVITDETIKWIKDRDKTKPFFLMHHYKAPHYSFTSAKRYDSYLADVKIPEPASLYEPGNWGSTATRGENDSLRHLIGTSISQRHFKRNYCKLWAKGLDGKAATSLAYQTYLKRYLRCVKGIDDNLKRLFDHLKEENMLDNTIIIYTGDQGFMLGEHDMQDKRWMYEESMRMPFIVRYPKMIKAGRKSDLLINNTDFAPTMLEMAKLKVPDFMQGKSFVKTLKDEKQENWRKSTYYRYWMHMASHYNPGHFGIRTKEWKLIFFYGHKRTGQNRIADNEPTPPAWELYNMKNDSGEMNNVYNNPENKLIVKELKAELKRLREELNETDENEPLIQAIIDKNWDK